jgi:hypothetical protein
MKLLVMQFSTISRHFISLFDLAVPGRNCRKKKCSNLGIYVSVDITTLPTKSNIAELICGHTVQPGTITRTVLNVY